MKKIVILTLICLSAITSLNCMAKSQTKVQTQPLDKIVAVVNDDVITHSEFNQMLSIMKIQMAQAQVTLPKDSELSAKAMEQLINKRLQLQMANQAGVQVTEEDLNKAIEQVAQSNNVSVNELLQHVNQGGMSTADYRNEVRDQMILQKLQQQELGGKIPPITPQEVNNLMRSKSWRAMNSSQDREYHLEDIIVPISDAPSMQEITDAQSQSEALVEKLQQGASIDMIKQSEEGLAKSVEAHDLGWHKLDEIPTAFTDVVAKMGDNQVSSPIQTSNGFHIVRLIASRYGNRTAPDRKQAEQYLLQRKIDEALKTWISKLRSQAYIVTNPEKA